MWSGFNMTRWRISQPGWRHRRRGGDRPGVLAVFPAAQLPADVAHGKRGWFIENVILKECVVPKRSGERRGFKAVRLTDGHDNEEKMPDVRYRWARDPT